MKLKRTFCISAAAAALLLAAAVFLATAPYKSWFGAKSQPDVFFKTDHKSFSVLKNGQWQTIQLNGVNLGSGYPGAFPGDAAIDEETYLRWLDMISGMNANAIRVYQLQTPAFYNALARHNRDRQDPLYLIQGMDFPDQLMYSQDNILDSGSSEQLFRGTRRLVDAVHGDAVMLDTRNHTLNVYTQDVSPYLLGYNLGVEWDELFVEYTCRLNSGRPPYQGVYFSCDEEATPFESFLAQWGDVVLSRETERYSLQPMVSFANWAETDPLVNEVQLISTNKHVQPKNKESTIDIEHIHPTKKTRSGLFAAYNVYPYYPIFLQYGSYTQFVDESGVHNPYQKYLSQLVEHHSCPVLISEYGLPSCRSTAYRDIWRNFSHGGLNEVEQGQAIVRLHRDIQQAGCAGSLVFTWQDEWFKRTWNEMMLSDPDRRVFWSNAQSAEQAFGLLSFDPGTPDSIVYPDGDLSEWYESDVVFRSPQTSLSMKSDERYLYFMVKGLDRTSGNHAVNLALDVTPKSGMTSDGSQQFDRPVDFIVHLSREGESSLQVHSRCNLLVYTMADKLLPSMSAYTVQDFTQKYFPNWQEPGFLDSFQTVTRAQGSIYGLMRHRYELNPAGLLKPGNGNPSSPDYNSNADYFITDDAVELRIPWQLLNFRDPSLCLIVDDLNENEAEIKNLKIDKIYAAPFFDGQTQVSDFSPYRLSGWTTPKWHERLKPAYYVLQEEFKGAN